MKQRLSLAILRVATSCQRLQTFPRDFDRMQMTDLEELNLMSGSISEKEKKYEKVRQEARKYIEGISFGAETPGTHVTPTKKASMMWKC